MNGIRHTALYRDESVRREQVVAGGVPYHKASRLYVLIRGLESEKEL